MPALQSLSRLSSPRTMVGLGAALLMFAGACAREDVGAPCNHGRIEPPESKLVTFPALACNDLLCVYADEAEAPAVSCTPPDNLACNPDGEDRFECVQTDPNSNSGTCRLRVDYVLNRSMCSKKCASDADCANSGITSQVVVEDTQCERGFKCARIQTLGKFCCEKLCVCEDDLGVTDDIDMKCSASTQEGCCVGVENVPEACGKQ